ncbi:hypothetical protein G6O69_25920 [Pseudenhygromyxa sp. WMMC2535]|uniref:protein-disulfide reductase DsbD domain-containing protein n=1 Tax=Pseudenhygromyxa sp. WMMC2535 TaxID=2712867 RepID=UPI0015573261|nr:protein-disulfide reductase DsbD domain-containing protein [Pseudenhygromyxa sp. WMMC2535]NVB41302.1 hypothetical protein [Pseudenhygromyxa sp. WMMC2535]
MSFSRTTSLRLTPLFLLSLGIGAGLGLSACKAEPSADEPEAGAERAPSAARDDRDDAPHVRIELGWVSTAQREALAARLGPSSPVAEADALLAVRHEIDPHWHIYWENPGDSGLRTRLSVPVEAPLNAGEVLYPGPDRFESEGGLQSFGWEKEAVLFVPIFGAAADERTLTVTSRWLACLESCIPGESEAIISTAALVEGAEDSEHDPRWEAMLARIPEPVGDSLDARWRGAGAVELRNPAGGALEIEAFFPYASEAPIYTGLTPGDAGGELAATLNYSLPADRAELPASQGVLRVHDGQAQRWLELSLPWPTN